MIFNQRKDWTQDLCWAPIAVCSWRASLRVPRPSEDKEVESRLISFRKGKDPRGTAYVPFGQGASLSRGTD